MSCLQCTNTTVRVDRATQAVTTGVVNNAEATIHPSVKAYYEPIVTDFVVTDLGRIAVRKALLVLPDIDLEPEDKIFDLGDNSRVYEITDYKKFRGSHYELIIEELKFGN